MPTRQGWTTLLAAAAAFAIGRVFGIIELYIIATGLVAAFVAAFAVVHLGARPHLRAAREVRPDVVQVGDEAEIHLRLSNRGHATTPAAQLWEPVGDIGGAAMRLAPLRPGEEAVATYRLPANRRGRVAVGPLTISRRDPFGLVQQSFDAAPVAELIVVPWHQTLPPPAGSGGAGIVSEIVRVRSLASAAGEFRGLRDYVPGDDVRRVHWKASARSEQLKVREVDASGIRRCMVVLDRAPGQYDAAGFERAVSAAASITLAAAASMPTRLYGGSDLDVRGPEAGMTALHALADVTVRGELDVDSMSVPTADGFGLIVLVTGSVASAAHAAMRGRANASEIVVVVACAVAPSPADRLAIDATSWEAFARGWQAVAGAAALLATRPPLAGAV